MIPKSYAPITRCVYVLPDTTAVIVSRSAVPASVPTVDIVTVPTVLPHISSIRVPPTPVLPTSPVLVPAAYISTSISFVVVPDITSVVIIASSKVPTSLPHSLILTIPITPSVSSLPPVVVTTHITSPVYVPATYLPSPIPTSAIITVPNHSSIVIVPATFIPTSVPTSKLVRVPTNALQTPIPSPYYVPTNFLPSPIPSS